MQIKRFCVEDNRCAICCVYYSDDEYNERHFHHHYRYTSLMLTCSCVILRVLQSSFCINLMRGFEMHVVEK